MKARLPEIQNKIPTENRNHTLDFLRGVAILGVVCTHCDLQFPTSFRQVDGFFRLGSFGVQLFFFVSALTMCYMWDFRKGESCGILKFYIRRLIRIAPLFWLAIPVYLCLNGKGVSHWAPEGVSDFDVFLTALFLHGFWPDAIDSVVPGGWSIAVEMTFYVVFPVLMLKLGKKIPFLYYAGLVFFINLLIISPVWREALNGLYPSIKPRLVKEFLQMQFFSQAYVFLLGMHLYKKVWLGHVFDFRQEAFFFFGWFALMGIWSYSVRDARELGAFFWIVCGFVLVVAAVRYHFRSRVLELLGRKSYSIYLSHFAMIMAVKKLFDFWGYRSEGGLVYFAAGFLCVLFLAYLIASLFYYLVEQPLHGLTLRMTRSF